MTKGVKFLAISSLATLVLIITMWSYCWLMFENHLKSSILDFKTDNFKFASEKVKISGFPFRFNIEISNPRINFNNLNCSAESLTISANMLFNFLQIDFPELMNLRFIFNNDLYNINLKSPAKVSLKLKERSIANTLAVIHAALTNSSIFEPMFLENIEFQAKDVILSNTINNKDFSKISLILNIDFNQKSPISTYSEIKFNFSENALDTNEHLAHKLSKLFLIGDIELLTRSDNNLTLVDYAEINKLDITANDSVFKLKGTLDKDEKDNSNFKFYLNVENLIHMLDDLLNKNVISKDRYDILLVILKEITGSKAPESSFNINLYSDPMRGIKIGNSSLYRIGIYLNKFISTP